MAELQPLPEGKTYRPREIVAWCLYDFANSPFTTLVVTFIYATFFTKVIAPDEIAGTALWSRGVVITALAVAFLSPFLGALADRGGFRKLFLMLATGAAVVGTVGLYWVEPGDPPMQAILWFVLANVAFEMGMVFYNAFLPDIAPPEKIGRISGYGWGLGYLGGLLALALALFLFVQPETPILGLSKEAGQNVRATNLMVAAWFVLFSLPIFLWVREDRSQVTREGSIFGAGLRQLADTAHEIRRYRQVVRFLIARLVFNDALVTIFAFGGIYAAGTFDFSLEEILFFGILINVTAGLGAVVLGVMDDRLGGKRALEISLWGLITATLLALFAPSKPFFWVAGLIIGIFSGPNQSASRSLMGRFVPPDKENEFFGFFAFSGKATAFIGPFFFGWLTQVFGTQRAGVAFVALLFLAGMWLLRSVDEAEGIAMAGRDSA